MSQILRSSLATSSKTIHFSVIPGNLIHIQINLGYPRSLEHGLARSTPEFGLREDESLQEGSTPFWKWQKCKCVIANSEHWYCANTDHRSLSSEWSKFSLSSWPSRRVFESAEFIPTWFSDMGMRHFLILQLSIGHRNSVTGTTTWTTIREPDLFRILECNSEFREH
jgi:hypothetical protein